MKKILPLLFVIISLVGGVVAGGGARIALGGGAGIEEPSEIAHGDGEEKTKAAKSGHGAGKAKAAFLKFSRQFVTPVIASGVPVGAMILDVNIEIDPAIEQSAYSEEPRLRDAVMGILLRQSAKGRLRELFADPAILDETKAEILKASQAILGDGAYSVLIMDIGYQPM